ncbi:hypothetical protein THIOM_003104 [Candidatus Thiomargarita nelsonii]|uniref:Uncharacterized protein n=1 Tax=Candidatus Thiomargarita nelsonii TaxID=1003181 RepID=A0A176RZF3_9GAMM|nr:hypothetical protein THIOM_003104 [Candidatus Thiomargarita nelsonii]
MPNTAAMAYRRLVFPEPFFPTKTIKFLVKPVSGSVKSNDCSRNRLKCFRCSD